MEVKKMNPLESLNPAGGFERTTNKANIGTGPSFKEMLEKTSGMNSSVLNPTAPQKPMGGVGSAVGAAAGINNSPNIKFSNHAIERMQSRGISFNVQDMGRLSDAVARAAAKGSKDSLILMNDSALIVSVKNNTVVTVMDKNALKENVFTNIDSTIVM